MNLRRVATFALAFAVALVVADRMMTARSVADDAATTRPATATAPAATRPTIPADAQAILDRITAAYAQTPLEVAGTFEQHFDVAGIRREQSLAIRGVARSDTTFRHETANALVVVADGKEGHVYDVQRKQFRSEPLNVSKARAIVAIQNPALAVAIEGNATLGLVPDAATNVHRLAADPLDGVGFDLEGTSVEVRVAAGGTIDRVRYDFVAYLTGRGAADVKRAEAIVRYAKSGTAEGDANADARFAFVPPADARELTGSDGGDAPVEVLEKGPAPAFALKDLDGGEVKLAEQKGHVVVLDFWATWWRPVPAQPARVVGERAEVRRPWRPRLFDQPRRRRLDRPRLLDAGQARRRSAAARSRRRNRVGLRRERDPTHRHHRCTGHHPTRDRRHRSNRRSGKSRCCNRGGTRRPIMR